MSNDLLIADILTRAGVVDAQGLSHAREAQKTRNTSLTKTLVALGLADEDAVSQAIAQALRLELLTGEKPDVAPDVLALLPADFCRRRQVTPLSLQDKVLRVAFVDPMDYATMQDVEFRTGKRVVAAVASETLLQSLLNQFYPEELAAPGALTGDPHGEVESLDDSEFEVLDAAKLAKDTKMPPVIRLVNLILSGAAQSGASDIHMEPKETHLQVRYRVDGLLHDVLRVVKDQQDATVSRMKIISGMDIADRRRPQDGRSRLRYEGKRIDLRVSTLPTQFGEKVVVRLLDSKRAQVTMEQLALSHENLSTLQSLLSRSQGMILVTGPTGCGKSSTLYTCLNWVKSPTKNIITVEDPIEYQLDGVNQVQINTRAGITFAAGLRSILRQDPNIIFVGEIRDRETAGICLEAAQTGHLLLSTLHTNDAPGAITRLIDLGIEPFLISSAVVGILAQRLVRRPCPSCVAPQTPTADVIEKLGGASRLSASATWVGGRGCEECRQSGYQGRIAIHELLVVNDEVRELITRRASEHALRKAARNAGMRTLLEDGISKAAQGLTTLEDVARVVADDEFHILKEDATKPDSPARLEATPATPAMPLSGEPQPISATPSTGEPARNSPPPSGKKERVLVVEDDPTIAHVVRYFLQLEGFEVLVVKDGAAGLQAAQCEQPRIIVTDCNMPGMDGMAMVKALRAGPATSSIAVLMLTSEEGVEKEAQALEAGVDDYIVKPVEPRRLAARVKAVLARSQVRHAASARVE